MEMKNNQREPVSAPPQPDSGRLESRKVEGLHQKLLEAAPDAMVLVGKDGAI